MNDLEQYLRDNKPAVQDDPTFILETRRRLSSVEGLKEEVDRQRRAGRNALIIALVAGLAAGVALSVLAFLYPIHPESPGGGLLDSVRAFLQNYRQYLLIPTALLATALGLVLSHEKKDGSVI